MIVVKFGIERKNKDKAAKEPYIFIKQPEKTKRFFKIENFKKYILGLKNVKSRIIIYYNGNLISDWEKGDLLFRLRKMLGSYLVRIKYYQKKEG